MKPCALACLLIAALALLAWCAEPAPPLQDLASLFPELEGWTKDEEARMFAPDNLFEHINGAAENFLAYGFRQLAVQDYVDGRKRSLSAEIYFHGSPANAFGIYGSEKPVAGDYFAIGSQGYAEEGVLNFIRDACYVKLNGFDLGPGGGETLKALAGKISQAIGGSATLPAEVGAFPVRGRIAHSERFILANFLGHEFLRSAFTADYELQGRRFQLFLIKPGGEEEARDMLRRYAALDRSGAAPEIRPGELVLLDPYNGPVRLIWQGAVVWGSLAQGEEIDSLLRELGASLAAKK